MLPHPLQSRYISERQLRPSDVPGTFLNIALHNVGSPNTMLRLAAYNLLCAMKDAFQLRFTGHILEAQREGLSLGVAGHRKRV